MNERRAAKGLKVAVFAIMAVVVLGFIVMSLWNWLTPSLFGLRPITFWEALGIFALSKILFGGFRAGFNSGKDWQRRMKGRWEKMSPEEHETFLRGMASRPGRGGGPVDD